LNHTESLATSVIIDIFSGFKFVSLSTGSDSKQFFWYSSQAEDSGIVLHVNKVSSEACGTCVTLQFRRDNLVESLAPAKLTVYPTLASPEAKEAYKQFFHVNSLNSSIAAEDTAAWRKTNAAFAHSSSTTAFDTEYVNEVQAAYPMPKICPCSFKCEPTSEPQHSSLPSLPTSLPSSTSTQSATENSFKESLTANFHPTSTSNLSIVPTQSTIQKDVQSLHHSTSSSAGNNSSNSLKNIDSHKSSQNSGSDIKLAETILPTPASAPLKVMLKNVSKMTPEGITTKTLITTKDDRTTTSTAPAQETVVDDVV